MAKNESKSNSTGSNKGSVKGKLNSRIGDSKINMAVASTPKTPPPTKSTPKKK
jgi:hypothetical protein